MAVKDEAKRSLSKIKNKVNLKFGNSSTLMQLFFKWRAKTDPGIVKDLEEDLEARLDSTRRIVLELSSRHFSFPEVFLGNLSSRTLLIVLVGS